MFVAHFTSKIKHTTFLNERGYISLLKFESHFTLTHNRKCQYYVNTWFP